MRWTTARDSVWTAPRVEPGRRLMIVCRSTTEGMSWVAAVGLDPGRCVFVPTHSLDGSVILAGLRPVEGDEVHYAPSAARGRHAAAVQQAFMVAGWPAPEVVR